MLPAMGSMGRTVRLFEGRFGRLLLTDLAPQDEVRAQADPAIVLEQGAEDILLLNPGELHVSLGASRAIELHAAGDWLRASFPAAFVLQELLLSIVETYLATRRSSSPLWRGSRFEDSRIRRAIALLRAHPNKDLNMDEVARQIGLSRSRFYDLFQVCTGFSPRAYLDMLCVETAISRLASGRGKIADVAAELGFSAQSNFTRFFLNQVGVPPSEYRRATAGGTPT